MRGSSLKSTLTARIQLPFEEHAQNGPRPALPDCEFLVCMAPRALGLCASNKAPLRADEIYGGSWDAKLNPAAPSL